MKNFIFFLSVVCIFASCKNEDNLDSQFEGKTIELSPKEVLALDKYDIDNPFRVEKLGQVYIFENKIDTERRYSVLYRDSNYAVHGVSQGQGPNEVANATKLRQINGKAVSFDSNYRCVWSIGYDSDSVFVKRYKEIKLQMRNPFPVDTNYVIGLTKDSYWAYLIDYNGDILSSIDFANDPELDKVPEESRWSIFLNSEIAVSPNNKNFVCGCIHAGYLAFGTIEGTSIKKTRAYIYGSMKIAGKHDSGFLVHSQDNPYYFICAAASDKYAIMLYSGKTLKKDRMAVQDCNKILFYDWNGKPKCCINVTKPLSYVRFDQEENIIYGICREDDPELVIYDMNNILE